MGFFDSLKNVVNDNVGKNYRSIYFERNPGQHHQCNECGVTLEKGNPNLTIDHIIPQNYGGTNVITNLQVLCRSCNSRKTDKINALTLRYSGAALLREIKNTFAK